MSKIHFEIGHLKYYGHDVIGESLSETESVFRADTLTECIKEWKEKGYTEPEYFIDIWEQAPNDVPYPIADIKLDSWVLNQFAS